MCGQKLEPIERSREMNEIERAIKELDECACSGYMRGYIDIALAALREKQEREKGCMTCWDDEDHEPEAIGTGLNEFGEECKHLMYRDESIYIIRFCPMCGRRLEVKQG